MEPISMIFEAFIRIIIYFWLPLLFDILLNSVILYYLSFIGAHINKLGNCTYTINYI